jgi:hypothetical protein
MIVTQEEAARDVLAAHDALRAAYDREPERDYEGMPYDPQAWLDWYRLTAEPAYREWKKAINVLGDALGRPVDRHPTAFRPLCEDILSTD